MKKKWIVLSALLCAMHFTAACGTDREVAQFKNDIDAFCASISYIDDSINSVDVTEENAIETVFIYLDQLDEKFQEFAALDFPAKYDYLEPYADEAGQYMATAVASYHEAYRDGGYNEEVANYARENSARAFKRVQGILSCLREEQ